MHIISSFPWIRRFALRPAFFSLVLMLMISLAACGGGLQFREQQHLERPGELDLLVLGDWYR